MLCVHLLGSMLTLKSKLRAEKRWKLSDRHFQVLIATLALVFVLVYFLSLSVCGPCTRKYFNCQDPHHRASFSCPPRSNQNICFWSALKLKTRFQIKRLRRLISSIPYPSRLPSQRLCHSFRSLFRHWIFIFSEHLLKLHFFCRMNTFHF